MSEDIRNHQMGLAGLDMVWRHFPSHLKAKPSLQPLYSFIFIVVHVWAYAWHVCAGALGG